MIAAAIEQIHGDLESASQCMICGSHTTYVHATEDRYGIPQQSIKCAECAHVQLHPRMSEADYAKFYEYYYRILVSGHHGRDINAQTIQADQYRYGQDIACWIEQNISLAAEIHSILDVGGSTGVVARRLADWFEVPRASVTVLDPCADELAHAQQASMRVCHGTLDDLGSGQFDLITICQTIDHILEPRQALEKCRDLLTPAGYLFVDFVDFDTTQEVKIDHPHNFNYLNSCRLLADYFKVVAYSRADYHLRFLCETQ